VTATIVQQHAKNFETLKRAIFAGNVGLLECKVKATGEVVAALCVVGESGEQYTFTPFALMVNGNPFEALMPPDPDRPGKFVGDDALPTQAEINNSAHAGLGNIPEDYRDNVLRKPGRGRKERT
jgi:hypothetical protein